MKRWLAIVSVAALILFVSVGCSSKKDDDAPVATGGVLNLKSAASPPGAVRENVELDSGFEIRLTVNRAGAKIYYTASSGPGNVPGDPGFTSSIYNSATPFTLDASYYNSTFIVKYFAWYQDPTTHNMEQEYPFNTSEYNFRPDTKKPTITITPNSGKYDPASVTITITASDPPNDPSTVSILYTMTNDGTEPEDPKTGSPTTAPSNPYDVPWTEGKLWIKAYAVDAVGNESGVVEREYTVDTSGWAQQVLELINEQRILGGQTELTWNSSWAAACEGHSEQIFIAERDVTLGKPDPVAHPELQNIIPAWWNEQDTNKRELMDFDGEADTGFFIAANAIAIGAHANSPTEFFNMLNDPSIRDDPSSGWMLPGVTEFGCGFYENVWEAMWNIPP